MSEIAPPEPFGPEEFAAKTGVSRETLARLKAYVDLLTDWNARHNLVSARLPGRRLAPAFLGLAPSSRHFIPPDATTLVDLGSGAGFPGLVLAEMLRGRVSVVLYEATAKKADFLEAAAATHGLERRNPERPDRRRTPSSRSMW